MFFRSSFIFHNSGSRPNSQRIPPDVANISPVNSPALNGSKYRNVKPEVGYRGVTAGRVSTASSEDEGMKLFE